VAFCRYYELDKKRAQEFVASFVVPDGDVQQARMLRDYLLRTPATGGGSERFACYGKAAYCCRAHYESRKITQIRVAAWFGDEIAD
jgi:hypothetical protein